MEPKYRTLIQAALFVLAILGARAINQRGEPAVIPHEGLVEAAR